MIADLGIWGLRYYSVAQKLLSGQSYYKNNLLFAHAN